MNYFEEIKNIIEEREVNRRVIELKDNREDLLARWNIGKLLVEARGGEKRAKYGTNLIKKWGMEYERMYGSRYNRTNLMYMRQFYVCFPIVHTLRGQLNWSHYRKLITIKDNNERNYYVNQVIINNLSTRELDEMIKNKSYERLSYKDKGNIELIEDDYNLTINDIIKDPILLKGNNILELSEKMIHNYVIGLLENKFLELGAGFALVGHEYKILVNNRTYKIDLLFFNTELNCYVVFQLKTRELKIGDKGQVDFYVNYVDKNLKKKYMNKTIGILIVKKNNKLVVEYTTNNDVYVTTYKLINN